MDSHAEVYAMNATSSRAEGSARKRHVLVVEDDEAAAAAYKRILCNAGYDVSAASDFRLALEILEAERALDVMVVDIVMPGSVNGLALSRMARMRRQNLKIIYITGYSIPGVEREALGPILLKPVDDERLIAAIEEALRTG